MGLLIALVGRGACYNAPPHWLLSKGGPGGMAHLLIFLPNTQILQMYPALHVLEFSHDEHLCSRMGAKKRLVFYRPEERKKESSFFLEPFP